MQIGTQRRSTPVYQRAYDFIRSGQFGDIVMVEMSWNVNQPGRWRRPDVVPQAARAGHRLEALPAQPPVEPFDPRKYLEFRLFWPYSSGIPDQWLVHQIDTVHWFTGLPRPRSVVANGGIYVWKDGRRNWDTMTAVFDYGPLNDPSKGFQVVYSSRMTNSAGGTKELYYSNGGTLDLDKNQVTPGGGLREREAAAMGLKPNLLAEKMLVEKAGRGRNLGQHRRGPVHDREHAELAGVRAQPQDAERRHRGGLQPLGRAVHDASPRSRRASAWASTTRSRKWSSAASERESPARPGRAAGRGGPGSLVNWSIDHLASDPSARIQIALAVPPPRVPAGSRSSRGR